ncbi:MAG: NADH-quinone oxidoreductase subunit L [Anaerolineae bacterium]|nr:NADH-quinone oxidoreductase subunit L [Anaerolineae bacterium]
MENVLTAVPLVVLFPLIGALINLFFGKSLGEFGVGVVAVTASASAFVTALFMWAGLVAADYEAAVVVPPLLDAWIRIPAAGVEIPWEFRVDTLSVTMMLVVSGVGTLIHLYATGYMHGDSRFPRFFVYLNLFLVFMMLLVTGNNLLMMFVGWEGVGLCSFLLIGFWFDKAKGEGWKNSNAARKAFIVNRIGDFGVLMAVFLTFWTFGTLDFYKPGEQPISDHGYGGEEHAFVYEVAQADDEHGAEEAQGDEAEHADLSQMGIYNQAEIMFTEGGHHVSFGSVSLDFEDLMIFITLFMLLGVTGKSAQIPLFVWLPDAMAGPTPVSALIHAATMVTAGVYMMVRSNVFFYYTEFSSFIVAVVGCLTAIMAGFIALGQWDVKRVLAYSTVSQLGFMVAAVGIGAYTAAMFHLATHAVFKALLFLGSGSIIHGMEHGHHHLHGQAHGPGHEPEHDEEHAHNAPADDHGHATEHAHHEDDAFDPQDMRNMGGLRHKMPITYWTYVIGTLALAGIFPLAGFWSKDEILVDALLVGWEDGELRGYFTWLILLTAAAFTAFYMWRQVSLVFYGQPRHAAAEHAAESSPLMTLPLMTLAVLTIGVGFVNLPTDTPILGALIGEHYFADWLIHSVAHAHAGVFLWWLAILATVVALGAIFYARQIYNDDAMRDLHRDPLQALDPRASDAFRRANARLYWDEFYNKRLEQPFNRAAQWMAHRLDWAFWHDFVHERVLFRSFHLGSHGLSNTVDRRGIDQGILLLTARSVGEIARRLRRVQTGFVRIYALTVVFGTVVVVLVILLPVLRDLVGI